MAPASLSGLGLAALLVAPSYGAYTLKKNYAGTNFTDGFVFRTSSGDYADYGGDPTSGFVNYVSKTDATNAGLVKVTNGQVYIGVDHTTTLSTSAQGRNSVRMEAKDTFTNGLLIADIAHMPGNQCGVWPAFWTYNFDEDPVGEVDIIEGAMHQVDNAVSLHTCGACSFTLDGQPGTDPRSDCNNGGTISEQCEDGTQFDGCGNTGPSGSYGDLFNAAGGGVYATQIESGALKIWYFPANKVPADITAGTPNPSGWSTPFVSFETAKSSNSCSITKYFKKQTIIINIDFCGDGVDQSWWNSDSVCKKQASTCNAFVAANPSAFADSYWLFNSVKLYQQ